MQMVFLLQVCYNSLGTNHAHPAMQACIPNSVTCQS